MSAEIIRLRGNGAGIQNLAHAERIEENAVAFGPFRFWPGERRLERAGMPVPLGGRAMDILMALVERAGEVVAKADLIKRVWPGVTVEEFNLRVNIASLRKALEDGKAGARYVSNVPGRGYCFVTPVVSAAGRLPAPLFDAALAVRLPACPMHMVGRGEVVAEVSTQLTARRFVTLVGPGGVGKTMVAVAVAHRMLAQFDDAVCFVDLAPFGDAEAIGALATALGITLNPENPLRGLIEYLQARRMLLIFDNCEHVIEIVSALSERIFAAAPNVYILAASRETLRVEGESICRMHPLASPPVTAELTAMEALTFPAVQLFVHAAAQADGFQFGDADAPVVADICRKLDGIPLAITLAANRVDAYGIRGIAALLVNRFDLLRNGRRTALPRHQTFRVVLDWSYARLTVCERIVLDRLCVFSGGFAFDAALAVAGADGRDTSQVIDAIASLVAKSMILPERGAETMSYRMLNMTRAYCLEKLTESAKLYVSA